MSDESQINLIDTQTNTVLYEYLTEVDQDNDWLALEEHPEGLFSGGFSACYAVIIKNSVNPKQVTLAHMSSIMDVDLEFILGMIEMVSKNHQFIVELARSKQGYTDQYNLEHTRTELETPDPFFQEKDEQFKQFFIDHLYPLHIAG
jgi:hypothetical protein